MKKRELRHGYGLLTRELATRGLFWRPMETPLNGDRGWAKQGVFVQKAELQCKHNSSISIMSSSKFTVISKIHNYHGPFVLMTVLYDKVNIDKIIIFAQPISWQRSLFFLEELSWNSITNKGHKNMWKGFALPSIQRGCTHIKMWQSIEG